MHFYPTNRQWVVLLLSFLHFTSHVAAQVRYNVTASSSQAGNAPSNVLDSDTRSIWHSQYSPSLAQFPHNITIDLQSNTLVRGFEYLPRQDGSSNGNIGAHRIEISTDGTRWTVVARGNYLDSSTAKRSEFRAQSARYVRLVALSEAGNRGPWASAATLGVIVAASDTAPAANVGGQWGLTINWPIVPVAIGLAPTNGRVIAWSAFSPSSFGGSNGYTQTATWDPASGAISQRTVSNTRHDMFCPGTNMDFNGRLVVTGGSNAGRTSTYDPSSDSWISGPDMRTARGYQSSVTLSDGRTFTIGGSWSGGQGNKNGEVYSPSTNTWTALSGAPVAPMLTGDRAGVYRADNHAWLFSWSNGYVFQAGPSRTMNWYGTSGSGSRASAGNRGNDVDAMCANAVMYDAVAGRIVSMGGALHYDGVEATTATYVIQIGAPGTPANATQVQSLTYARSFANAVVLPDGKVFVNGGQRVPAPFTDDNPALTPELWDPATQTYTQMAANTVPRTYHSVSILLLDGTVFTGGGGLCGTCTTNHFDAQIFEPPYLFNADGSRATRPAISSVSSSTIPAGSTVTIVTGGAVSSFSLIRYGTTTHTVNTDQRRIPLQARAGSGANTYAVTIPSDRGVALPGYWMLFAIGANGVPSVARSVRIS